MTTGPESLVKKDVALILQKAGAWIYMSVPHGYGRRGIPDFLGCYLSFMFAIECKATAGMEPSPWQRRELDALRDAGAWTWSWEPRAMRRRSLTSWSRCAPPTSRGSDVL
jgi:hypothetical protein